MQNVRRWIEIVATDSVSKYANLETVKGYKRIVVCQGIIDDAEAVVGPDNSLKFLKSIIDGRLEPTSWLNAVRFRAFAMCNVDLAWGHWLILTSSIYLRTSESVYS